MSKQKLGTWRVFRTLKEYFDFFKDIPENKWCTGEFKNYQGQMCALGLVGERAETEKNPLRDMLSFAKEDAASINNGYSPWNSLPVEELGDSPKERILNAIILKESGILNEVNDV